MADYKHDHPGQKEPRAHGETHHESRIVDLNTASEEELADLPMVRLKCARDLMQHRPFKSWDEVQNVPGFDRGMIDHLKNGAPPRSAACERVIAKSAAFTIAKSTTWAVPVQAQRITIDSRAAEWLATACKGEGRMVETYRTKLSISRPPAGCGISTLRWRLLPL